ncbi:MAG TPA: xanthine dehydrogenase family protein subunit M [Gemmatimonadaceae bacterium]|jgi:xanthine dehydrogenase YagS FAD-binding subunit
MIGFDYIASSGLDAAIREGSANATKFIAGGTTLVDLMKLGVENPSRVVDLNTLRRRGDAMSSVTELAGGGIRLGALAHMSDVAWDPRVKDRFPLVSQALLLAASGQIRNMATMGGNVLQRTRCPYFRDTAAVCNKREPGSGCSALHGLTRSHAILGTSDKCIATHPSDLAVAFAALDATVNVHGPSGARMLRFADLHTLPGQHPERETTLHTGDVITSIDLPGIAFAHRSMYLKVRDRTSFAFALASAAVALDVQNGTIRNARVGLGGVATKPWRSREAERALIGKPATRATFVAAANAALVGAAPHRDNAFKVELAKRTLVRALTEVSS